MSFLEENSAQTSLEMLLLIGGAIILATIVGYFVKNLFINGAQPLLNDAANKVIERIPG